MGKSKWFCQSAKPRPNHILKKDFKIFLRLTAMASRLNPDKCKRPAYKAVLQSRGIAACLRAKPKSALRIVG